MKKSPITKEDNRISGAVANALCLRHSEQDAYSNRKAAFYFFFLLFRDNLKCRNPKCIPLHILNATYQTLKGHCQDKDHTQHLKHLMGKKNSFPSYLPEIFKLLKRRHGFWKPSDVAAVTLFVYPWCCLVKEMRLVSSGCWFVSCQLSALAPHTPQLPLQSHR